MAQRQILPKGSSLSSPSEITDSWRDNFSSDKFRVSVPTEFGEVLSFTCERDPSVGAVLVSPSEQGLENPMDIFSGIPHGEPSRIPQIPLNATAAEVIRKDEKNLHQGRTSFGEVRFTEAFPSTQEHETDFFSPCPVGEDALNLIRGTVKQDATLRSFLPDNKQVLAESRDSRGDADLAHLLRLNNILLVVQGFLGVCLRHRLQIQRDVNQKRPSLPMSWPRLTNWLNFAPSIPCV